MKKIVCVLLLFCTVCTLKLFAQDNKITVKGIVLSQETNLPMPGASIVIKGESKGMSTDSSGSFSIRLDKGKTIAISYVGFDKQELSFSKSQTIVVQLKSTASSTTDEVVVIGYGTQKKSNVTGAVPNIKMIR